MPRSIPSAPAARVPAWLVCPSDPEALQRANGVGRTGYLAGAGPLCLLELPTKLPNCPPNPQLREADADVFTHRTWLRPAQVSDGLAHTMMFSERAVGMRATLEPRSQRWVEGGYGATLMSAAAPPNLRGFADRHDELEDGHGALSFHPNGVCLVLGDGAARYASNSVDSWAFDAVTGGPVGAVGDTSSGWSNMPTWGIWQALATRAGGDGPVDF